ncbi:MAG: hypothetical protein WCB51_02870 [Candidatus Dormiibacterota bacterium]
MHDDTQPTLRRDVNPEQGVPAPPADPSSPGFALPSGVQPSALPPGTQTAAPPPPPALRARSRRFAGRTGLVAITIAIVVVAAKVLLFSGAGRLISGVTTQSYHVPSSIAGDAKSSAASVTKTVNDLTAGIQLPSLQGGHIEGAGYTDAGGQLEYMFVIAQDNADNDSERTGMDLNSQFKGPSDPTLGPLTTSNFSGVTLDCATATVTADTGSPTFNACDWYNANAAGFFVDYKSASVTATVQLATSVLQAMAG